MGGTGLWRTLRNHLAPRFVASRDSRGFPTAPPRPLENCGCGRGGRDGGEREAEEVRQAKSACALCHGSTRLPCQHEAMTRIHHLIFSRSVTHSASSVQRDAVSIALLRVWSLSCLIAIACACTCICLPVPVHASRVRVWTQWHTHTDAMRGSNTGCSKQRALATSQKLRHSSTGRPT